MSDALIKVGPLAGFLLAVGYCVWPHVAPPPHQPAAAPSLPEITAALLSPPLGVASPRDPFSRARGEAEQPGPSGPTAGPPPAPGTAPPERPAPRFSLGATVVSGDRRAALIDGRVYRPGEPLEAVPGGPSSTWTVARIEPGFVRLRGGGRGEVLDLELDDARTTLAAAPKGPPGRAPDVDPHLGVIASALVEAGAALSAAGLRTPALGLLERLAGGGLADAPRELLGLLTVPPARPAGTPDAAGGEGR